MASPVPAKSQPLHSFPLPQLKWNGNHQRARSSSGSAARLSSSSPHPSPPLGHDSPRRQSLPTLHSPSRGSESTASQSRRSPTPPLQVNQSSMRPVVSRMPPPPLPPPPSQSWTSDCGACKLESPYKNSKPWIEYRRQSRNSMSCSVKNGVSISSPDRVVSSEKLEKKLRRGESEEEESRSSKFLIKFRAKSSKIAEEVEVEKERRIEDNERQEEGKELGAFGDEDDDEPLQKTWNLRPRKPIRPSLNLNGSGFRNNGSTVPEKRVQPPQVNHNTSNKSENQKKEKRMVGFSLTLSREEIEEDIYALTQSKPSRRPRKRSKAVQKLIENVFPGAWLQSITADLYKVSEHPGKV